MVTETMKIMVDWLKLEVDLKFEGLADYARILEDQIERLTNAEKLRLRRTIFSDEAEWQIAHAEHQWLFEGTLPRLLRQSCIVSLFTAIETSLSAICEALKSRKSLKLSARELKDEPIRRTQTYIRKVADIDLADHAFTGRLKDLSKVRNWIVHSAGQAESSEEAKETVNRLEGIRIGHDGYIEIDKGVCFRLIQEAHEWVEHLRLSAGLGLDESK